MRLKQLVPASYNFSYSHVSLPGFTSFVCICYMVFGGTLVFNFFDLNRDEWVNWNLG